MISSHMHFKELPSTHRYAMQSGSRFEDFAVITADFQTKGRGRRGRDWVSPPGKSLLASIVLKPQIALEQAALVTPILSLAVCEILETVAVKSSIRWPNDVMVKNHKIAGILSEASYGDRLDFVVVSCGLNVNQDKAELAKIDRPATSVFNETGKSFTATDFLEPLLTAFKRRYSNYLTVGPDAFFGDWVGKMDMTGEGVLIGLGKSAIAGRVVGFRKDGSIEIRDTKGTLHSLHAGEVVRMGAANQD